MPELHFTDLPKIIEENNIIKSEVENLLRKYLQHYHPKGWTIIEGAKKYIAMQHFLIEAPIQDQSLGGFIRSTDTEKYICYVNTYQPRIYQNFSLLHELYHLISLQELEKKIHIVHAGLDTNHTERKADYFASLLLMDEHELINFYNSFEKNEETTLQKIFLCMSRFKAPFKAILIRLYELQLIDYATIKEYFDQKFDYHKEFEALGIDSYMIERSNVIHFGKIEKMMQKYALPEAAQQANKQVLEEITRYFHNMKGDAVD
ncbi:MULTISPECIES: ImmA/IrrE family metallo-endopeptidase [unclassified Bacillus cereus group]|uniref:ImmA/IrrE family metallo-endopeptidase n=1 Tax=unclassified Bacillus cereus group TaxID=2750818 RepID=UPI001F5A0459|nr:MULTISPECIES: ImmA/IrrE family metallo-endopeptidase [unclassified Bacillus cereus group]